MNPDEEDPAQDRLSALRQAGFVDALWPVPQWVNLPTSRAKRLTQEPMSGASGDCRLQAKWAPLWETSGTT